MCDREAGVSAGPGRSSAAQILTPPRRFTIVTCVHNASEPTQKEYINILGQYLLKARVIARPFFYFLNYQQAIRIGKNSSLFIVEIVILGDTKQSISIVVKCASAGPIEHSYSVT